jgi:hypothetical protein
MITIANGAQQLLMRICNCRRAVGIQYGQRIVGEAALRRVESVWHRVMSIRTPCFWLVMMIVSKNAGIESFGVFS